MVQKWSKVVQYGKTMVPRAERVNANYEKRTTASSTDELLDLNGNKYLSKDSSFYRKMSSEKMEKKSLKII